MSAVPTIVHRLRSVRTRPLDIRKAAAVVSFTRLRLTDEDGLRYVFNDWERDCGVKSNQEAQVNAVMDRSFQRTVHESEKVIRKIADGTIVLPGHVAAPTGRTRTPLSERGWSPLTARPGKIAGAAVRVEQMAQPERWTLMHEGKGKGGASLRRRTLFCYRALVVMGDRGEGRHVVTLFKLYGPKDPAADYLLLGDWAPIAHLTPTARELAVKATRVLRRAIAERHGEALETAAIGAQNRRMAMVDRASIPRTEEGRKSALLLRPGQGAVLLEELEGIARAEAVTDIDAWKAKRAEADRSFVEPRHALHEQLRKLAGAERKELVYTLQRESGRMLARAATSFYAATGAS